MCWMYRLVVAAFECREVESALHFTGSPEQSPEVSRARTALLRGRRLCQQHADRMQGDLQEEPQPRLALVVRLGSGIRLHAIRALRNDGGRILVAGRLGEVGPCRPADVPRAGVGANDARCGFSPPGAGRGCAFEAGAQRHRHEPAPAHGRRRLFSLGRCPVARGHGRSLTSAGSTPSARNASSHPVGSEHPGRRSPVPFPRPRANVAFPPRQISAQ